MAEANYYSDQIHCKCGSYFSVGLENDLSDQLWDNRYLSDLEESEKYVCPNCKRTYELTIAVEVVIERKYTNLVELEEERFVQGISLALLKGAWIGDRIVLKDPTGFEEEEILPTGIYVSDEKEYHVNDGIITDYWSIPDNNQLNLFEETLR